MCDHSESRIVKTTGTHFTHQCLKCGHKWNEVKEKPKATFIEKLATFFSE